MRTSSRKDGRPRKRANVPDGQLELPLFEHGLQAAHQHPLVATADKVIKGRRPPAEARKDWNYVESNPPHAYAVMLFDIDDPDRWEHEVDGPLPNWQVRKDSQPTTYHVAYTLEHPVARHNAAKLKPLGFFRDIYDGLAVQIGADHRYSGLMMKNPLQPPPGCSTQWFRPEPYTLAELRDWLPAEIPKPVHTTGIGRNEDLFRHCVRLAHQPRWARIIRAEGCDGRWLNHVRLMNTQSFAENPLPDVECRSIAKSCARYSMLQYSEETFRQIQTARNTKRWHPGQPNYDYRGRAETADLLVKLGYTVPEIAAKLRVSDRTVQRDLAKVRKRRQTTT